MSKSIREAREIKRRLTEKGLEVDENVIRELLESCIPKPGVSKVEHIINMITGSQEHDEIGPIDEAGPSTAPMDFESDNDVRNAEGTLESDESWAEMDFRDEQISAYDGDIIDVSASDSDDDREYYYQNTYSNEDSSPDTVTQLSPLCHLSELEDIQLSTNDSSDNQAAGFNDSNHNQYAGAMELIEENNNDPNNNLENAIMPQEITRSSCYVASEPSKPESPKSPKPGCSKDDNDLPAIANETTIVEQQQKEEQAKEEQTKEEEMKEEQAKKAEAKEERAKEEQAATSSIANSCDNEEKKSDNPPENLAESSQQAENHEKLQKNAVMIHALLPRFEYSLILRTLLNNRWEHDYVGVTLLELLSKETLEKETTASQCSDNISTETNTCQSLHKPNSRMTAFFAALQRSDLQIQQSGEGVLKKTNSFASGLGNEPLHKMKKSITQKSVQEALNTPDQNDGSSPTKKIKMSDTEENQATSDSDTNISNVHGSSEESNSPQPAESTTSEDNKEVKPQKAEPASVCTFALPAPVTAPQPSASSLSSRNPLRQARFTLNTIRVPNVSKPSASPSVSPSVRILTPARFVHVTDSQRLKRPYHACSVSGEANPASQSQSTDIFKKPLDKAQDKKSLQPSRTEGVRVRGIGQLSPPLQRFVKPNMVANTTVRAAHFEDTFIVRNPLAGTGSIAATSTAETNAATSLAALSKLAGEEQGGTSSKCLPVLNSKLSTWAASRRLKNVSGSRVKREEAATTSSADFCTSGSSPLASSSKSSDAVPADNDQRYAHRSELVRHIAAQRTKEAMSVYETQNIQMTQPVAGNSSNNEVVLNEMARRVYHKLIPMFPCMSTDYIKRMCQKYIKENEQFANETFLLQNVAEQLLDNQEQPDIVVKQEPAPLKSPPRQIYDLNDQYANLLSIFPDADPIYLRGKAEEMYNDAEKVKEFVQSKLENPDYPTREQYLTKKKITEQQKRYTSDFNVQEFLEIFPDPFAHFENEKRQCQFHPHAVEFLKHYFNKIRMNTLLRLYSQQVYNLSLTVKNLERVSPDMKTKRQAYGSRILTDNIPLLQECAFIQHKAELRKYLDELKEKEEKEFNELKARNELLECQCCYDNECMPSKCSTCEDGHIFCNTCIVRSTDVILADGKTQVDCLINCGCGFPLSVLQRVLTPTKFSILLKKRQEEEVMAAGLDGLVSCPFCHFASIPPSEDKVFKCLNPDCMKESCRLCKEINHVPLKCNEAKSDAARLYLEERMTEALVRKCYRCGKTFIKEEGCNKMTCPCGATMCYLCDKPVTNYTHFRGQGAPLSSTNLCPLWSDDMRMNAESVIKVCHETMKQIKEKNPKIDINVDALLPKLPPKRRGPHEDVGPVVLPVRANRIARQFP